MPSQYPWDMVMMQGLPNSKAYFKCWSHKFFPGTHQAVCCPSDNNTSMGLALWPIFSPLKIWDEIKPKQFSITLRLVGPLQMNSQNFRPGQQALVKCSKDQRIHSPGRTCEPTQNSQDIRFLSHCLCTQRIQVTQSESEGKKNLTSLATRERKNVLINKTENFLIGENLNDSRHSTWRLGKYLKFLPEAS